MLLMGAGQDWRRANRVLHLQCHFGRDSLILAQRGARVVGLDFSEPRKVRVDPVFRQMSREPRRVQVDLLLM
jgi:cyclopropane fatty-acyl-phospholipid synthase-like methyltransferase